MTMLSARLLPLFGTLLIFGSRGATAWASKKYIPAATSKIIDDRKNKFMSRRSILKIPATVIGASCGSLTSSALQADAAVSSPKIDGVASSSLVYDGPLVGPSSALHNQVGVIWDSIRNRALPATPTCLNGIIHSQIIGSFLTLQKTKGLIFVSERHDDFQHHSVQLKIIQSVRKAIAQRSGQQENINGGGQQLAIGMECFLREHQTYLDKFIASKDDDSYTLNDLRQDTNWSTNWGYDLMHYAPILLYAQQKGIQLVGLHPNYGIIDRVETMGLSSIPSSIIEDVHIDDKSYHYQRFRTSILPTLLQQESILLCDGAIESIIKRQYEVLCFREEYMAESIAQHQRANQQHGSWMIALAGERHILHRDGIPLRALRRIEHDSRLSHPNTSSGGVDDIASNDNISVQNRGFFTVIPRTTTFPVVAKEVPSVTNADYVWFVERDPNEEFDRKSLNASPFSRNRKQQYRGA